VAIVGGGLTGVVAALHLARNGAKVHLFEQHTVGFGASGRNGGMATTGMSIGSRQAVANLGFDTAVRLYGAYTKRSTSSRRSWPGNASTASSPAPAS